MGKYLFTLLVLVFVFVQASAQLEPAKIYFGISSENRFGHFINRYGIKPQLAYALDEHSSIGIHFNYFRSSKLDIRYADNAQIYNVQFGAGINYSYFRYFKSSHKLGWYANVNLDINRFKAYDIKYSGQTMLNRQYNLAELSLRPGIFYTLSKNVMFFASPGGVSLYRSNGSFSGGFNFASQANIGVQINLDVFRRRK